MAYEVIARKWRPQQFSDVLGQEHVSRTLTNAIESKRVAHAYLFVGPRGTGKTSTARILAKALNCEKGPTPTPCDACTTCREITSGSSLDVIEIDGASNNGVEQVRDLRENVHYAPARAPFKIYIIDEVHMLSTQAFNALLKTLEEPPKHVKFVFATTEPQKVPATILSRCQRFDLRRIPLRNIVDQLRRIAVDEQVEIDEAALLAIARGAEGGMRDAESALDQLISFRGSRIDESDVLAVFGLVSWSALEEMMTAILDGDVAGTIRLAAGMDEQGKDLQRLVVELIGQFRNLLIALHAPDAVENMDLTEAQAAALCERAQGVSAGRILRVVDLLTDLDSRMRQALSRRTLLETALIRCARAASMVTIDELIRQVSELRTALVEGGGVPSIGGGRAAAAPVSERTAPAPEVKPATSARPSKPPPVPSAPTETAAVRTSSLGNREEERQYLQSHWREFTERVGAYASLVKGYLLDARPVSVSEDLVTIGFDPEFGENVGKIDTARNRNAIQKMLSAMLNREVRVALVVLDVRAAQKPLPADHAPTAEEAPHPAPTGRQGEEKVAAKHTARHDAKQSAESGPRTLQQWLHEPAVSRVINAFNGDIEDIRD